MKRLVVAALSILATTSLDLNNLIIAATPVLIAAMAHSLPIAVGGQGLSAGAMVLMSATTVTALPSRGMADVLAACVLSLLAGAALGAVTGYLVGKLRARSSVVTLSIGAASTALSLDFLNRGTIPSESVLYETLFGAQLFGIAIAPLIVVAATCLFAHQTLKRLQLDRPLQDEPEFAQILQIYILAGLGSATAGIFLGGSLGFINASIGVPILIKILAAVALGGALSVGNGNTVFGSLCLLAVIVLTEFGAVQRDGPELQSTSIDACFLFAAIAVGGGLRQLVTAPDRVFEIQPRFRFGYSIDVAVLVAIAVLWPRFGYTDIVLTVCGVLLLAVGQTAVARLGYLDLSMPALISIGSTAAISLAAGQNYRLLAITPCLVLLAVGIGIFHGCAANKLQRAVISLTIATAGVIQSASTALLVYLPGRYAPSVLLSLAERRWTGLAALAFLAPIVICLLLSFSVIASRKSSPQTKDATAFVVSAASSIIFGILLAGLNGTTHYALVDVYTFPAIAAAVLAINFRRPPGTFIGAAALFAIAAVIVDSLRIFAGAGYFISSLALAGAVVICEIKMAGNRGSPDK